MFRQWKVWDPVLNKIVRPEQHILFFLKMNLSTDLPFFTKSNSKWSRDLKVKCKTMTLLEDNVGEKNLGDVGFGNEFLDTVLKT